MKVLVFTSLFPNNVWRNQGIFVKERISEIARLGRCEMKVVAPVPFYPPIKFGWRAAYNRVIRKELVDNLEVCHPRYFMIPKIGMILQGWMMFVSLIPFIKELRSNFDFDLIDAHYVYPDGFAAVLLGRLLKKPVVVSARGSDVNQFAEFPVIRNMLRYTLNSAAGLIAVCEALKDEVATLGIPSSRISVIPNGVDTTKFFPTSRQQARETLGLPIRRRIILCVGALIPRKGHDYTIRSLKLLTSMHDCADLLLVLAGSGPERNSLEILVQSLGLQAHVRFLGEIPHQQLQLWYSAADVSCLVSSKEGWPNVVLESLACGTPVVATDVWGIPEIIRSDTTGLLTKQDDREIAATLYKALTRKWCSDSILEFASQNTWVHAAEAVQSVFESIGRASSQKEGVDNIRVKAEF